MIENLDGVNDDLDGTEDAVEDGLQLGFEREVLGVDVEEWDGHGEKCQVRSAKCQGRREDGGWGACPPYLERRRTPIVSRLGGRELMG